MSPEQREKDRARSRARYHANKESEQARNRAYHAANREKRIAQRKAWGEKNKDREKLRKRHYNLLAYFGITLQERNDLLTRQGNSCAICRTTTPGKKDWATDHCHVSGKVRGILCHACNTAIGHLRDDPALLRAAAAYLESHHGE